MTELSFNTYGKTRVRLVQVLRNEPTHEVLELNIGILFQGDFNDSYTKGDNSRVLPTDTMKNTVYALARQHPIESIENFALLLGRHFLERLPFPRRVTIDISQTPWSQIANRSTAFLQDSRERRTAQLTLSSTETQIVSGLKDVQVLKTSHSAFHSFLKDEYTTLPETRDRLLNTVLDADWTCSSRNADFNSLHTTVREMLLNEFAEHDSLSVQHTLYAMAEAVMGRVSEIDDIHLTMPNKHCLPIDLSKFGLDNPNQIFVPTDEPSGFIEARLKRSGKPQ